MHSFSTARSSQSNKLELCFRPEDPYSHPAFGELHPCNGFLLKISKRKLCSEHDAKANGSVPGNITENERQADQPESEGLTEDDKVEECISADKEANLCADVVAHVSEAYHFNGMFDYQYVVPVHAEVAQRKKRNWSELEEPHFGEGGLMDVDHEDIMLIVPPLFAPKDMPENLVLRPPATSSSKRKQEEIVQPHLEMDTEPVLAIGFDIKEVPKIVNWEEYIPQGSDQWESQMAVSRMFDERPIWSKDSLIERLHDKGLSFSHAMLRRLLSRISYYFSSGPFLRFWIKKGYDPRKDPDSRIYQRLDYRVPIPLRSYCDAQSANTSKHRWGDICAFHAFPCKFQTSLQLFELVDDYIQSEINKPPLLAVCTFATGWFTQNMLNCIRQRIMVRFLSVFPKPGAENLLRSATAKFEKMKRDYSKIATKPEGEGSEQSNLGLEEKGEADNVDDEEVAAAEANNSDEEWDAYEELDLVGDCEIPLPSHSNLSMENLSRTHLQDLFVSFPSNENDNNKAQEIGSDEEYQIYQEDSDKNNSDE
ncbi:transcription factor tau subunit sfc1 isoform X2 [Arachis ipaensis]|uniref:transcription factor tau subunit sfc1 isoform X2 n=1 Tax=Arachis ipaensis TaxID=130454 RepID=UPI000A2B589E|nr:transcription factor tau subunit sfc1 isoform X2 [Arachis ipaensis]